MSTQIEQAALSSLLNGGWNFGGHELTPEDFIEQQNRAVFVAIQSEAQSGEVDQFTVANKLDFEIDHLIRQYTPAKRIGQYVAELKDATLKREIQKAAASIRLGQGSGREQLLQAQSLLASLEGQIGGEARPIGEYVDDWWQELGTRSEGGNWIETGFSSVDRRLGGLRPGNLMVLAGRPAMGKTALALNIAKQCGRRVGFFSLEMTSGDLLDRIAAADANIPLGTIRSGQILEDEWPRLTAASTMIRQQAIHLDQECGLTIDEIHARARSIKAKHGLDLVIVDYLQLIASNYGQSAYERVTHISQTSKRMAKDLEVPVIMLAQVNRKCEVRDDKRPISSDLRDSGSIEQDADLVAFVYRDEVYDEKSQDKGYAELIFRKVRQGEIGTDWFKFDGAHQIFKQSSKPTRCLPSQQGPYK
ncbi:replicative DNA helicase [Pseudomonadota bacterium]